MDADELDYYRLLIGQKWKSALGLYLGVEFPSSALNSEGGLNVHMDYGTGWGSERGRLLHRVSYDNRSAIYSVMSLVNSGGLVSEMRGLRSSDPVGYEHAKKFLSVVCSIPDSSGVVFGYKNKSSNWFGLFAPKRKPKTFKELGLVLKSRGERIDEIYRLRKHECPEHLGGEIVIEKQINDKGSLVPVAFSYLGLIERFPDIQVIVAGGLSRIEIWRERDKGLSANG